MIIYAFFRKILNKVIISALCLFSFQLISQITAVKYQLKYNADSCWYDTYLIIESGSATLSDERLQSNSSFSVLVPAGTNTNIVKHYMPIENNASYSGTIPNEWLINAVVGAPTISPQYDFYMFSPSLDSVSHYNNLNQGDTIRLFSFTVDTIFSCGAGIRIFDNNADPGPTSPGMGFIDFKNIFSLDESVSVYTENAVQINPNAPEFSQLPVITCYAGIEINIDASTNSCQEPLKYAWSGPNGFQSSQEDISILPAYFSDSGMYTVTVSDSYGCKDSMFVNAFNKPNAGNDIVVCSGSVVNISGDNPNSGIWSSFVNNPNGANLTNLSNGMASVTFDDVVSGTFNFIYTANLCSDTLDIVVLPSPVVSISGDSVICIGASTNLSPNLGGFWVSNQTSIATVTNEGLVNALAEGTSSFTFTETASGCSATTPSITIHPLPAASISGTPNVCVGSETTLSPVNNGIWLSENISLATINNTGVVTGISTGQVSFTFTDTLTGCISNPIEISVLPKPTTMITGNNIICVDATTNISPSSGGMWNSLNPAVAVIDNFGLITGTGIGSCSFIWTEMSTGCTSDTSQIINVIDKPIISMADQEICTGSTTLLTPNIGGTWISNNPSVATVGFSTGVITGVSYGDVTFTFTNTATGCSNTSENLHVVQRPEISATPAQICVGSTALLTPKTGGIWISLDNDIATVADSIAIGTGTGLVTFLFADTITGCQNTLLLSVTERASVMISGDDEICEDFTSQLSPSTGGIWTSSNSNVALVDNEGLVTGVSAGIVFFNFTESSTGCNSLPTPILKVNAKPEIQLTGPGEICIGATTGFSPSTGGIWTSNNTLVATIDNLTGDVTGVGGGTTTFYYTSSATGCESLPSQNIHIYEEPSTSIAGPAVICIGGSTFLSPSTGGIWTSENPAIASVDNIGFVSGVGAGTVHFTYTETEHGCNYTSTTEDILITPCFNPDFNVTTVNIIVNGNLNTNDFGATGNTFFDGILTSAPSGSNPMLLVNPNGSYTFQSDSEGVYIYIIPVCLPGMSSQCPFSELTITVIKNLNVVKTPVANADLAVVSINASVDIMTLRNDSCVVTAGCYLDPSSVHITVLPLHGNAVVNTITGDISYAPNLNFTGVDSLVYEVCVLNEATNCASARQIISVIALNSENTTLASDDFKVGSLDSLLTGNILQNDTDAEGDLQFVTSQVSSSVFGDFSLNSNGDFSFAPAHGFIGPIEFIYEVCDDNAVISCTFATLHLLILPDLTVQLRAYLEGALMNNANANINGRPLMRDNLRVSPFNGSRYIPASSPYKIPTSQINIIHKYQHVGVGTRNDLHTIVNPEQVFGVTGRDAIVDWVFVELRAENNQTNIVASRSGLIQRDGDIVDIDGVSPLSFAGTAVNNYYTVVRHRNHLGVMSATPISPEQLGSLVDFTFPATQTFDFGTTLGNGYDFTGTAQNSSVKSGYKALWAGDFDANKKIKAENPNDDLNNLFFDIFIFPSNGAGNANYDFAIGYHQGDFDLNSKAKFDNPNDDKNMLIAQLLFYPINFNIMSNFDFFIEQIP